jgi:hypothetical protein
MLLLSPFFKKSHIHTKLAYILVTQRHCIIILLKNTTVSFLVLLCRPSYSNYIYVCTAMTAWNAGHRIRLTSRVRIPDNKRFFWKNVDVYICDLTCIVRVVCGEKFFYLICTKELLNVVCL